MTLPMLPGKRCASPAGTKVERCCLVPKISRSAADRRTYNRPARKAFPRRPRYGFVEVAQAVRQAAEALGSAQASTLTTPEATSRRHVPATSDSRRSSPIASGTGFSPRHSNTLPDISRIHLTSCTDETRTWKPTSGGSTPTDLKQSRSSVAASNVAVASGSAACHGRTDGRNLLLIRRRGQWQQLQ